MKQITCLMVLVAFFLSGCAPASNNEAAVTTGTPGYSGSAPQRLLSAPERARSAAEAANERAKAGQ